MSKLGGPPLGRDFYTHDAAFCPPFEHMILAPVLFIFISGCSLPERQFYNECEKGFKVKVWNVEKWKIVRLFSSDYKSDLDPFPMTASTEDHRIKTIMSHDPPRFIMVGSVSYPIYDVFVDNELTAQVRNPVWVTMPYEFALSPSCSARFPTKFRIFADE